MSAVLDTGTLGELAPAFADPVHDGQQVFRMLLEAMSRPGRIQALPALAGLGHPAVLQPALAASLLTLLDADTRLWLSPQLDQPALRAWCRFHCGAQLVAEPEQADFAVMNAAEAAPAILQRLNPGDDVAPQDSATVLIAVDSISADGALCWQGPGIEHQHRLGIAGACEAFWNWRQAQQADFPCGIDIVFAAGDEIVALPRSTQIGEA